MLFLQQYNYFWNGPYTVTAQCFWKFHKKQLSDESIDTGHNSTVIDVFFLRLQDTGMALI